MKENTILSVEDLAVSIHTYAGEVQAVRGVTFSLKEGEALAIVGESGCGKSVTAQTIMKLNPDKNIQIKSGKITLDGEDIVAASKKKMQQIRGNTIGMIFQDPMTSLNPTMKVGKQLGECMHLHTNLSRSQIKEKSIKMLEDVRIPNGKKRYNQYPGQFSGGMRQRAMIGVSIACIPKVLIADEPTTALDVTIQAQILDLLKSIQKEENMSIILITHDLGVAATLAQKIAVMYAGRIVEQGSARDIFENPTHPYTIGLLKSIPRPDMNKEESLFTIQGTPPSLINPPDGCAFASRCQQCMKICQQKVPPRTVIEDGHECSCWLLQKKAMEENRG